MTEHVNGKKRVSRGYRAKTFIEELMYSGIPTGLNYTSTEENGVRMTKLETPFITAIEYQKPNKELRVKESQIQVIIPSLNYSREYKRSGYPHLPKVPLKSDIEILLNKETPVSKLYALLTEHVISRSPYGSMSSSIDEANILRTFGIAKYSKGDRTWSFDISMNLTNANISVELRQCVAGHVKYGYQGEIRGLAMLEMLLENFKMA